MTYKTHAGVLAAAFLFCGIMTTKKTHLMRTAFAQVLLSKGSVHGH